MAVVITNICGLNSSNKLPVIRGGIGNTAVASSGPMRSSGANTINYAASTNPIGGYGCPGATGVAAFTGTFIGSFVSTTSASLTVTYTACYIATSASPQTFTPQTSAGAGQVLKIQGRGAGGWIFKPPTGRVIRYGTQVSSSGAAGSVSSLNQYDNVHAIYDSASTTWYILSTNSAGLIFV